MDPERALQEVLDLDTSSSDNDQVSLPSPRDLDCEVGSDYDFDGPNIGSQSPCDVLTGDSPPTMETSATDLEVNVVRTYLPQMHVYYRQSEL